MKVVPSLLALIVLLHHVFADEATKNYTGWLVNHPSTFSSGKFVSNQAIDGSKPSFPIFTVYERIVTSTISPAEDGESLDLVQHFFWHVRNGLAIELGAGDGTPVSGSMTYWLERMLGWKRILVEANQESKDRLVFENPEAFIVNGVISDSEKMFHYRTGSGSVGGILEFMDPKHLRAFHKDIYDSCSPPGNISSLSDLTHFPRVKQVEAVSLSEILKTAKVKHVNYFLLDVEGAELSVLKTIDWEYTLFDVISVETDPGARPEQYGALISSYLAERGYTSCCGQVRRNMWFLRNDFKPKLRPNLKKDCFVGALTAASLFKHASNASRKSYVRKIESCFKGNSMKNFEIF